MGNPGLYRTILALSADNRSEGQIMEAITGKFPYLHLQTAGDFVSTNQDFSSAIKNAAARKAGVSKLHTCSICAAPIHPNAVSWDHTIDKKDGGAGDATNPQPTHPFCNRCKDELIPLFDERTPSA